MKIRALFFSFLLIATAAVIADDDDRRCSIAIEPGVAMKAMLGSSALTNFPVVVYLSESGIKNFRYDDFRVANHGDIVFTDAGGNALKFCQYGNWTTTGTSKFWVNIPELTAATKFFCRYGGSAYTPESWTVPTRSYTTGTVEYNVDTLTTTDATAFTYGEAVYSGPGIWVFIQ